jgi:hypothetical protein
MMIIFDLSALPPLPLALGSYKKGSGLRIQDISRRDTV